MTTEANAGGTSNAAPSSTNSGDAPSGASLLTEGASGATEVKDAGATGAATESKDPQEKSGDEGTTVPEKYEFKLPEGVELDTAAADQFGVLAKELKLDQATAQKLVDIAAGMQQRQAEQIAQTVKGWADTSKVDREFGGDKLSENLAIAQKAIDTFGSSELKTMLIKEGLGNHPEVIRFAFRVGKQLSEDAFAKANARSASAGEKSPERRLYPGMN